MLSFGNYKYEMRAAIHNPYLDTLGGGERYTLGIARVLLAHGFKVDLEWNSSGILQKLGDRFGLKLNNVNVINDIKRGDGYDLCFWVSDGSIPVLKGRRNILHFQVPFHDVNGKSLINRMKLFRINKIVCNSRFTKNVIDKEFGVESVVVYPPVDISSFKAKRKDNLIISIGRFSHLLQSKGQEVLIDAFKKFSEQAGDWKLVLAGGTEVGAGDFLKKLEEKSKGYPIEIIKSPSFNTLKDLYGRAKFYWSASGFGVNGNIHPERLEHFGIAVVEAMSAGAVPFVFNGGGSPEIIDNGENGFLWKGTSELIRKARSLSGNKKEIRRISQLARQRAVQFSYDKFEKEISSLL